jgi:hypothetical protein
LTAGAVDRHEGDDVEGLDGVAVAVADAGRGGNGVLRGLFEDVVDVPVGVVVGEDRRPQIAAPDSFVAQQEGGGVDGVIADSSRPRSPYQVIADGLRSAILSGALPDGYTLPTVKELAIRHHVSPATAHRAITVLVRERLATVSRGRRATVHYPCDREDHVP